MAAEDDMSLRVKPSFNWAWFTRTLPVCSLKSAMNTHHPHNPFYFARSIKLDKIHLLKDGI